MNCEEVTHRLSEYLDKSLDTATTTRIATHVISCALCRNESKDLLDGIQQVAALPSIDPPLGFAQRVMAHIHDSEPKLNLWQRVFLPLTKRAPLPAGAFAMVAVLAVFLYRQEAPLPPSADSQLALRSETPAAPEAVTERKPANRANAPAAQTTQLSAAMEKSVSAPAAQHAQTQGEIAEVAEEKIATLKRPPLRVQEVTTGRQPGPMFGDPRSFAAPQGAPIALERPIPIGDRATDLEFVVRRRSSQRRDSAEVPSGADTLQKSPSVESAGRARIESIAEIIFYNVAPEHFDIFKKELASEANIESEPKSALKEIEAARQADRQLLIKVTILPAERATSAR